MVRNDSGWNEWAAYSDLIFSAVVILQDEVVGRSKVLAPEDQSVRLPVAHMVCNQTPPVGDTPSLMTFREVETLFHEFGHALQHMVSQTWIVSDVRN